MSNKVHKEKELMLSDVAYGKSSVFMMYVNKAVLKLTKKHKGAVKNNINVNSTLNQ